MTMLMFSIFDSKASGWMQPFFCVNRAVACREFTRAVNDPVTGLYSSPGDFELFEVGSWDAMEGKLVTFESRESLGVGVQFKRAEV